MNPMLNRTFKALCAVAVVTLLSACGSSSTVDPFKPTRVIGLGDTFNDIHTATGGSAETVRIAAAGADSSVVGHVATLFGTSNVVSYASSTTPLIAHLATQIDNISSLSASTDLVVITVGTHNIIAGDTAASVVPTLNTQIQRLLDKGARHILIMPPLDLSKTPTPPANAANAAVFISNASTLISDAFAGRYSTNTVIFGSNPLGYNFSMATASRAYPYSGDGLATFNNTYQRICAGVLNTGCDLADDGGYLFADGFNLTPTGNKWVAQNLYNATAQGWR